jgi:hypothetical protein
MIHSVAEIKPLDILGPLVAVAFGLAMAWLGIGLIAGFVYLLVQPFYAIATGQSVEEDSLWLWGAIVVVALVYWQLS